MGSAKYYIGQIVSTSTTQQDCFHISFDNGGVDRAVHAADIRYLDRDVAAQTGGEIIAEALRHNRVLHTLDLGSNRLGQTAVSIAHALRQNPVLVTLSLHNNGLDQVAAEALATGLLYHPSLRLLDLSNNSIGTRGAECLAALLLRPRRPPAAKGSVNNAKGGEKNGGSKAPAACLPCGLTALNLSWNEIKSAGAVVILHNLALAAQAKKKAGATALTYLDLSSNGIDDDYMPTTGKHSLCGVWEERGEEHAATAEGGSAVAEEGGEGAAVPGDGLDGEQQGGCAGCGGSSASSASRAKKRAEDYTTQYFGRYAWRSSTNPAEHSYRARVPEMLLALFKHHRGMRRLELAHNRLGKGTEAEYLTASFQRTKGLSAGKEGVQVGAAKVVSSENGIVVVEGAGGLFGDDSGVGSCVCEQASEAIAVGLMHNCSLRRLGVGFNPLGMQGTLKIVKALKKGSNLTLVSLGIENTTLESNGSGDPRRNRIAMEPMEVLSYLMNKSRLRMRLNDFFSALDVNKVLIDCTINRLY
jgi:hypothetical protein